MHLAFAENTLSRVEECAVIVGTSEELTEMLLVFVLRDGRYKDVVDVYVAVVQALQHFVHKSLECLRRVPLPERHIQEFE